MTTFRPLARVARSTLEEVAAFAVTVWAWQCSASAAPRSSATSTRRTFSSSGMSNLTVILPQGYSTAHGQTMRGRLSLAHEQMGNRACGGDGPGGGAGGAE